MTVNDVLNNPATIGLQVRVWELGMTIYQGVIKQITGHSAKDGLLYRLIELEWHVRLDGNQNQYIQILGATTIVFKESRDTIEKFDGTMVSAEIPYDTTLKIFLTPDHNIDPSDVGLKLNSISVFSQP